MKPIKPTVIHFHISPLHRERESRGFALVVTLSLMVLLLLLALGMLSLSSISLRTSSRSDAQAEARANARLALMLAIGELQKAAGPDQRITTDASIFGNGGSADVEHPHYLAVFDSWDTYLNEKKYLRDEQGNPTSQHLSIQDTYQKGRHPDLFRRYLVSHANSDLLGNLEAATDANILSLDDSNSVLLAGEGTTGSTEKDKTVRAGLLNLNDGNRTSGRMAWWVGGLNSKPSIDLQEKTRADHSLAGEENFASEPQGPDIAGMDGLENFPATAENKAKMITVQQGAIIAPDRDAYNANSLNLGAGGQWSLLTDVRGSGMKKDLNAFFENPLPADYQSADFLGVQIEAPLRSVNGLDQLGVVEKNIPPTSWRQLRDYYSMYLQDTSHPSHLGYNPAHVLWKNGLPVSQPTMAGEAPPWGGHHTNYINADTLGYARGPVIVRWLFIFSLSSEEIADSTPKEYQLYLHVHPVIVLWNPYSTQLRIETRNIENNRIVNLDSDFMIELEFRRILGVEYKVYKNDQTNEALGGWTVPTDENTRSSGNYFDSYFEDDPDSKEVMLNPGEVKIFSYDQATLNEDNHNSFLPGFSPQLSRNPDLRQEVGIVEATDTPSIALRFKTNRGFSGQPTSAIDDGGSSTMFCIQNFAQVFDNNDGKVEKMTRGPRTTQLIDWFDLADQPSASIIPDRAGERAEWNILSPDPTNPLPEAVVGMFLKSGTELPEADSLNSSKDVRSRNWLHGNPSIPFMSIFNPDDLKRSNFPYELHYDGFATGNSVAFLAQSTPPPYHNAFIGASNESGDGMSFFPYQELPVAPATNLAALSGMRLAPGKTIDAPEPSNVTSPPRNDHYSGAWGATFGHGIGNAYAHPMIGAEDIYTAYPNHKNYSNQPVFANYWDTLLMANDAMWDSWFCSSVAPQSAPAYSTPVTRDKVLENFVKGTQRLPNHRLRYHRAQGRTDAEIIADLEKEDAYLKMASHMMVRGGFNVNTASVEAWKALLHGLKGREIPVIDALTLNRSRTTGSDDELVLSRFGIATGAMDGKDPADDGAWRGIRRLDNDQIDRLAEEIAKQVRLRGPFLNMSDFINRRLSDDRFGVSGALQAAIDWDEFDKDYDGTNTSATESNAINGGFKQNMIKNPTATYVNPRAARGSRFAGIPGYVMQSDLLRAMGNVLTVRDDSFVIRAYGDALDANGKVTARAWCEATVQRMPEYIDPDHQDNAPEKPAYTLDDNNRSQPSATLSDINRKFGRKFSIQSFRWLSPDEVL